MKKVLHMNDYARDIHLFDEYSFRAEGNETKEQLLDALLAEIDREKDIALPYPAKRRLLHAAINTLPPNTFDAAAIKKLNRLLQLELQEKDITDAAELSRDSKQKVAGTRIAIWQGDITTLKADAIVNAANSQMLGCWQPLHACIDNAIHTAAGVQLRDDCHIIMQKQGFPELTGTAKITRAYNLPSRFVLHTVGPIVQGAVTGQNQEELASAYTSCLDVCKEMETIRSIAFCCISTGVFGYPPDQAADLALRTVTDWLEQNPGAVDLVVFNVFSDNDNTIYQNLVK